jgi:methyl-accepting chemotaxis protein
MAKPNSLPDLLVQQATRRNITRILQRLAMSTGAITLLFALGVLLSFLNRGLSPLAFPGLVIILLILGISIATYTFAKREELLLAIRIYSYGIVALCTVGTFIYGGVGGPIFIGYVVPIAAAGLLGRSKDSLYVAAAAAISYAALTIIHEVLHIPPIITIEGRHPFAFLFFFLAAGGILAYIAWLTSRDLNTVMLDFGHQTEQLLDRTRELTDKSSQQVELGSELSAAASELQVTSQQQASGATEQASAVSQVSTTVEELGATARQIAQSADHVAQAAQQTLEHLSSGQGAVDESVQAMERIRTRMQDISTRVLSLGERSQQIGEIIDLIDDISDETHLLALNAAIEAAGAGEHGRRFAVVAAEVKSLANRTLAAAKEVQGVIAEIRQATNAAVLAAEEGGKEVERGAELSYRAGQVMDTILMVAERTAQSASEIGMATAQQQSASEQVVEAMREIAEVARQSASGSRQMAESAAMLTAIADRLHGITHQR